MLREASGTMMKLLVWIALGGVVGWVVSRITKTEFRGGVLGYVVVGVVTMVLLGWLLSLLGLAFRVLWVLIVVALLVVAGAWLLDTLRKQ
jgi:uncharacterized membrane protein YeaQ/YmgE (transglycosylase-associated protein family)